MAELKKYRLKPTDGVDAMLLDGTAAETMEVFNWVQENTDSGWFDPDTTILPGSGVSIDPATGFMMISTKNGVIQVKKGEWIIQVGEGQFAKATHEDFSARWETVDGSEMPQPTVPAVEDIPTETVGEYPTTEPTTEEPPA